MAKGLKICRIISDGLAFLLAISCIVWLVAVLQKLPDRFVLSFNDQGKISEWGTPVHFIIVFLAGMAVFGGLSVVMRFKNMFGVSLFDNEYRGKAKYEATMLLFSLLKVYTLALFLTVMYNMYVRVRDFAGVQPADWLIFLIIGLMVLSILLYVLVFVILYEKRHRHKDG